MNPFAKTLLAMTLAGTVAGAAQAQEKVLHVYNWSDYIAEDTLENFTKETGIKVVYDVFDSNEVLEAKLLAGSSGYDVVVPSNPFLAKQIKAGVFQKLDKSSCRTGKTSTRTCSRRWIRATRATSTRFPTCGAPSASATTSTRSRPRWATTRRWTPGTWCSSRRTSKLKSCGVAFLDSPTEMLPAALHYLGYATDSGKADELKKAEDLFMQIRPHVAYFHSSKYISDLANGNICVAIGYSGDIYQGKSRAEEAANGVNVGYKIPKEGAGSFFDMLAVPADAKNVENAHVFLNYLMKPDVMASITNYVQFPNGNAAATPLLDEAIRTDEGIYPSQAVLQKLYTFPDLDPKTQRAMTRSWTKIKSGR